MGTERTPHPQHLRSVSCASTAVFSPIDDGGSTQASVTLAAPTRTCKRCNGLDPRGASDPQRVQRPTAIRKIPCGEVERIEGSMPFGQERPDPVNEGFELRFFIERGGIACRRLRKGRNEHGPSVVRAAAFSGRMLLRWPRSVSARAVSVTKKYGPRGQSPGFCC